MDEAKLRESKSRAIKSLIGAILIAGLDLGTLNVLSNYTLPLSEKLGVDSTSVILIFTIASILSTTCNFIVTASGVIEKYSIKVLLGIGCFGFIGFFAFAAFGNSLVTLYIGAALFGVSKTFASFSICHPLINFWHTTNVGKKITSLMVSYSAFAVVMNLIVARAIAAFGVKNTLIVHGIICGAVMVLACYFLVSNRPETYGLQPYGKKENAENTDGKKAESAVYGLTFKQSLKTFPFWVFLIVIIIAGFGGSGYTSNASLIYQGFGMDAIQAGDLMAMYTGLNVVWTFIFGALCDKIGAGKASVLYCGVCAIIFIVSSLFGGIPTCYLIAIFIPMINFYGQYASILIPKMYGNRAIGRLINASMIAMAAVSIVIPVIVSTLNEMTGTYLTWLRLTGVLLVISTILLVLATSKKSVEKLRAQF